MVVAKLPPVREIPWHDPVVPRALAVIKMVEPLPVAWKLAEEAKPTPPLPRPWIKLVAAILPVVEKAALLLIPLLPPVPPMQPAIATVPSVIEEPNVTVPVLPVVHALVLIETP